MKEMVLKNKRNISLFACMITLLSGCLDIPTLPGRPLRINGEVVRTDLHLKEGSNWAKGQRPEASHLDESTRAALEAFWLQDARGEHASIPAFSRISWQLAAIGSPPELLAWAHRAALEEISHAQLCFALAEGYGGHPYSVQPILKMFESGLDFGDDPIEVIATETLFDGCLLEGFFANIASVAAIQCEEPATLAALEQIAREEKSHAAFSWALLEWLLEQHPTKVKPLIQNAYDNLETYSRPHAVSRDQKHLVEKANPELLIKHGRLSDEQWQKVWDNHIEKTQQDLQKLLKSKD